MEYGSEGMIPVPLAEASRQRRAADPSFAPSIPRSLTPC